MPKAHCAPFVTRSSGLCTRELLYHTLTLFLRLRTWGIFASVSFLCLGATYAYLFSISYDILTRAHSERNISWVRDVYICFSTVSSFSLFPIYFSFVRFALFTFFYFGFRSCSLAKPRGFSGPWKQSVFSQHLGRGLRATLPNKNEPSLTTRNRFFVQWRTIKAANLDCSIIDIHFPPTNELLDRSIFRLGKSSYSTKNAL